MCPKCKKRSKFEDCVVETNKALANVIENIQSKIQSECEISDLSKELCQYHGIVQDMFCVTDQTSVCRKCAVLSHKEHRKHYRMVSYYLICLSYFNCIQTYKSGLFISLLMADLMKLCQCKWQDLFQSHSSVVCAVTFSSLSTEKTFLKFSLFVCIHPSIHVQCSIFCLHNSFILSSLYDIQQTTHKNILNIRFVSVLTI